MARWRHWRLTAAALPSLILDPRRRFLLAEMRAFCRLLPDALKRPLPEALQRLTPVGQISNLPGDENATRAAADLAALLERRSPLGLCLRRSLVRYHFLRRLNVPVVLQFGAKFVNGEPDRRVTGHAWLTLNGEPYHEADENWRGFAVMFSFP